MKGDHLEKEITFTWWVYRRLGKGNRRVIPSHALWVLRNMYPELDGNYVLYNEGDKDRNIVDIVDIFTPFIRNK